MTENRSLVSCYFCENPKVKKATSRSFIVSSPYKRSLYYLKAGQSERGAVPRRNDTLSRQCPLVRASVSETRPENSGFARLTIQSQNADVTVPHDTALGAQRALQKTVSESQCGRPEPKSTMTRCQVVEVTAFHFGMMSLTGSPDQQPSVAPRIPDQRWSGQNGQRPAIASLPPELLPPSRTRPCCRTRRRVPARRAGLRQSAGSPRSRSCSASARCSRW
jgi:hypothetical protein